MVVMAVLGQRRVAGNGLCQLLPHWSRYVEAVHDVVDVVVGGGGWKWECQLSDASVERGREVDENGDAGEVGRRSNVDPGSDKVGSLSSSSSPHPSNLTVQHQ